MTEVGTFEIQESFNITGRRIVLSGHPVDHTKILLGFFVEININDTVYTYKITGVDMGNIVNDKFIMGILVDIGDPTMIEYLNKHKIKDQTATIFKVG